MMIEQTNNIETVRVVKSKLCWGCGKVVAKDEVVTGLRGGDFCSDGCYGNYWCGVDGIDEAEEEVWPDIDEWIWTTTYMEGEDDE